MCQVRLASGRWENLAVTATEDCARACGDYSRLPLPGERSDGYVPNCVKRGVYRSAVSPCLHAHVGLLILHYQAGFKYYRTYVSGVQAEHCMIDLRARRLIEHKLLESF